ncbi:hypothetical protein [Thermicanus aegyptius]|uniref:hypothetical protein n=1 Tax=Thermicanus aegyptius TaxID=94009 RepID=UPI000428DBD6|nr:hypothetical protein [Thermicanus aegyptius]
MKRLKTMSFTSLLAVAAFVTVSITLAVNNWSIKEILRRIMPPNEKSIVQKVEREFWHAIKTEDYERAGSLVVLSTTVQIPEEELRKFRNKLNQVILPSTLDLFVVDQLEFSEKVVSIKDRSAKVVWIFTNFYEGEVNSKVTLEFNMIKTETNQWKIDLQSFHKKLDENLDSRNQNSVDEAANVETSKSAIGKETPYPTSQQPQQNEPSAPEEDAVLSLEGWIAGERFSEVQHKIPQNVSIEYDNLWDTYIINLEGSSLQFTGGGILDFILVSKDGLGLSNGLKVGASEGIISDYLGTPSALQFNPDYTYYDFEKENYDIIIFTKSGMVDSIRMKYKGEYSQQDQIAISKFYKSINNNPENGEHESTASSSGQKVQTQAKKFDKQELNNIWLDLANKVASYTVITRSNKTDNEVLKKLNEVLDELEDILSLLESSEHENDDNSLYWNVRNHAQQVDDLYFNKAWGLQLKINGEEEKVYSPFLKEADSIEKSLYK